MSKLLTVLAATAFFAACSQSHDRELTLAPGATYIALGTEVDGSLTSGATTFSFSKFSGGSVGAAAGGPQPISHSDSLLFKPASITKLVTTSLALQTLGSDFRFATRVYWAESSDPTTARDLVIMADGDPQVVKAMTGDGVGQQQVLAEIAQGLKQQGIARIEGKLTLISEDERHDAALPCEGLEDDDYVHYPVSQSFNIDWNSAPVAVSGGVARFQDPAVNFPLNVLAARGPLRAQAAFTPSGRVSSFSLTGAGSTQLPISSTKSWYARSLVAALSAGGINASGAHVTLPVGDEARAVVATLPKSPNAPRSFAVMSEPLSALVAYTNKPSDDFMADDLFKVMAERHGGGADLRAEGQQMFREATSRWLSLAGFSSYANDLFFADGAGLSQNSHVSARAYLQLLKVFSREPWFPVLYDSLPIAGRDGTLKTRMIGSPAAGVVHAKTGTLRGAYQLAGYVPKLAGGQVVEHVPFVILTSVDPSKRLDVYALQTDIASKLLTLVNP